MWTAFPSSDYYEDSVTIGVSPRRPSRVPLTVGDCLTTLGVVKTWLVALIVLVVVGLVLVVALTLWGVNTKTEGG